MDRAPARGENRTMSTWMHRVLVGLAAVSLAACSSSGGSEADATSSTAATAANAPSSTPSAGPVKDWTVTVTATVKAEGAAAPFALEQVGGPTVMTSLDRPVALTLKATADAPVVVSGSPNLFTTRMKDTGTLDVIGPICLAGAPTALPTNACSADPSVLAIGVGYAQVPAPKPTGALVDAADIRLSLLAGQLKAGTYHLDETVSWFRPGAPPEEWKQTTVGLDFVVTGPA